MFRVRWINSVSYSIYRSIRLIRSRYVSYDPTWFVWNKFWVIYTSHKKRRIVVLLQTVCEKIKKNLYNHRKCRIVYDFKNSKFLGDFGGESLRKTQTHFYTLLHTFHHHKFDKLELEVIKVELCWNTKKYFFGFVQYLSRYRRSEIYGKRYLHKLRVLQHIWGHSSSK